MDKKLFLDEIGRLIAHYGINMSEERIDFYYQKLSYINNIAIIQKAIEKWKSEYNYFPPPSQLEKIANSLLSTSIENKSIRFKQEEKGFAKDFTGKKEKTELGRFAFAVIHDVLDGNISGKEGMEKLEQFMEEHNIHPQEPPDPGDFPDKVLKDLNITEDDVIQYLLSRSSRKSEIPHPYSAKGAGISRPGEKLCHLSLQK